MQANDFFNDGEISDVVFVLKLYIPVMFKLLYLFLTVESLLCLEISYKCDIYSAVISIWKFFAPISRRLTISFNTSIKIFVNDISSIMFLSVG